MHNKVARFARNTRVYKLTATLEQQGALATGAYEHQLHGVFGRRLQTMRSYMCDAVAPRLSGRCCATLLDLCAPDRDPVLKMPRECLQS
eukprot:4324455-Pyramimonas_sp.AAC.1